MIGGLRPPTLCPASKSGGLPFCGLARIYRFESVNMALDRRSLGASGERAIKLEIFRSNCPLGYSYKLLWIVPANNRN